MSHESGNSSGVCSSRSRVRVVGVPKRCWCGELVIPLTSHSKSNPYRRYFRCAFAAEKRLTDDNHSYKWIDEALLDKVEGLSLRIGRLEQSMVSGRVEEEEKKKFDELGLKLETEIFARMEDIVNEAKASNKKAMVMVVLGCLTMIVLAKVF